MKFRIGIIDENLKISFLRYFCEKGVEIVQFATVSDVKDCDLLALYNYNNELPPQICDKFWVLNLHPSLLPAFEGENAIKNAFISGVKISGVTVENLSTGKILAQYPVFISYTTTFEQYCTEIEKACDKLYPVVADAVLYDRVFDFTDIINSSCSGGCAGNCQSCKH